VKEYLSEIVSGASRGEATNKMREYLQARILESLQERGAWRSVAFMGGTALRFLYRTPRFSEDLDFSLEDRGVEFDLQGLIGFVCTRFAHEGYVTESRVSTRAAVHKAFVRFPGLEHELGLSPHADKVFSVKVEVDTNPPAGAGVEVTTVRRFVTLRLAHHDKATLLAGKIAAVLLREWVKGRDIYDLVWYLSDPDWPEPNAEYLNAALLQAGAAGAAIRDAGWSRSLQTRVQTAPWDHVLSDVERFLERPADKWMLDRETVMSVVAKRGWPDARR
jgi:predicted nucleotidyltransferase component of viral defense system